MLERMLGTIIFALVITQCVSEVAHADSGRTLEVILQFSPAEGDDDESTGERRARLEEVAAAVDGATRHVHERAVLIGIAAGESRFARYLQEYRCEDGPRGAKECDSGRATGLWQGHHAKTYDTAKDARKALSAYRFGRSQCGSLEGALSWYATGNSCKWSGAAARARHIESIESRLW